MLWRACRGNVFLRQAEIETPLEDPSTVSNRNASLSIEDLGMRLCSNGYYELILRMYLMNIIINGKINNFSIYILI